MSFRAGGAEQFAQRWNRAGSSSMDEAVEKDQRGFVSSSSSSFSSPFSSTNPDPPSPPESLTLQAFSLLLTMRAGRECSTLLAGPRSPLRSRHQPRSDNANTFHPHLRWSPSPIRSAPPSTAPRLSSPSLPSSTYLPTLHLSRRPRRPPARPNFRIPHLTPPLTRSALSTAITSSTSSNPSSPRPLQQNSPSSPHPTSSPSLSPTTSLPPRLPTSHPFPLRFTAHPPRLQPRRRVTSTSNRKSLLPSTTPP